MSGWPGLGRGCGTTDARMDGGHECVSVHMCVCVCVGGSKLLITPETQGKWAVLLRRASTAALQTPCCSPPDRQSTTDPRGPAGGAEALPGLPAPGAASLCLSPPHWDAGAGKRTCRHQRDNLVESLPPTGSRACPCLVGTAASALRAVGWSPGPGHCSVITHPRNTATPGAP